MTDARRSIVIGAVVAVHAGLLALLLTNVRVVPAVQPAAIAMHQVPSPAVPAPPPPDVKLAVIAADVAMPTIDTAETADDCPLLATIAAALGEDRNVGAALAARPETTAMMIWDGSWSSDPAPAMAPIRRIVVERVRASSAACRTAEMIGPRLIMVPNGTKAVAVAIGSGTWNWRQLLS